MYLGYLTYPETWLLDEEKVQLAASPWIVPASPVRDPFACEDLLRAPDPRHA